MTEVTFSPSSDKGGIYRGYRNQIVYLTGEVKTAIEGILANSTETPIIVIQGDHGPGSGPRFRQPGENECVGAPCVS